MNTEMENIFGSKIKDALVAALVGLGSLGIAFLISMMLLWFLHAFLFFYIPFIIWLLLIILWKPIALSYRKRYRKAHGHYL